MARLSGVTLPEGSHYVRRVPWAKKDDPDFVAAFDQHTLFYDVFYDDEDEMISLVGPSLRTQRALFQDIVLKVDGERVECPEVELLSPRTSQLRLKPPSPDPKKIRLLHRNAPKLNVQVSINRSNTAKFAGKNALVAISKNNDLTWIKDWLTYYVDVHGANAVVLIDNGSDAYQVRDIRRAIHSVTGIEALEIMSAPYPFGPKAVDRMSVNSKFLHLSALHIAHRRFLRKANAVLSVDIDELVTKPANKSVFDAAREAETGFISIPGSWRYARPPQNDTQTIRHADHTLMRIGPDANMQPKWCLDPTGPLAGLYWRVHGVIRTKRNFDHDFRYLHCRQITTSWDYDRDFEPEERFEPAPEATELAQVFGQIDGGLPSREAQLEATGL